MLEAVVIGHLGGDAKVTSLNKNKVINFSVAHSQRTVDAAGNPTTATTWLSCAKYVSLDNDAKVAAYLKKGAMVYVRGDLSTREYEQAGEKKIALNLRVSKIELLPSGQSAAPGGDAAGKATVPTPRPELDETLPDDPLPF